VLNYASEGKHSRLGFSYVTHRSRNEFLDVPCQSSRLSRKIGSPCESFAA
jgi:hypothetical protein